MQEVITELGLFITVVLIAVTHILIWCDWVMPFKALRWLRDTLDFKPFNCTKCLSYWIGAVLAIVFLNPIYLALPLFTKGIEKIIY